MFTQPEFLKIADNLLESLLERVEAVDTDGEIDAELADGILTLGLPAGRTLLVNRHTVLKEIWVSSPVSGGHHFAYRDGEWQLPDGTELEDLLKRELKELAGIEFR